MEKSALERVPSRQVGELTHSTCDRNRSNCLKTGWYKAAMIFKAKVSDDLARSVIGRGVEAGELGGKKG